MPPNPPTNGDPYATQPGSAFAFNFDPYTLTKLSANPNQPVQGTQAPSGFGSLNFQSQNPQGQVQQQQNPVGISAPSLLNLGAGVLKSGVSSGASAVSGVTGAINNFGATLGFANPAATSLGASVSSAVGAGAATDAYTAAATGLGEAVSPALAAADTAATAGAGGGLFAGSLSGSLGAAGLGAIGGKYLAGALGENETGGAIGGAIGAGIGYALFGPLGGIGGGALGSVVGGLFGNNTPPTSASSKNFQLSDTGSLIDAGGGSKNPSGVTEQFVQSAHTNFGSVAQTAANQLGVRFSPDVNFGASDSTRYGGPMLAVDNKKTGQSWSQYFDPKDSTSSQAAYQQALIKAAEFSGISDTSSISNWYTSNYIHGNGQGVGNTPSVPSNPQPNGQSDFQKFVDNYKAQQNANAA